MSSSPSPMTINRQGSPRVDIPRGGGAGDPAKAITSRHFQGNLRQLDHLNHLSVAACIIHAQGRRERFTMMKCPVLVV